MSVAVSISRSGRSPRVAVPAPWALAGVAVLGVGLFALIEDVEKWNAIWYVPAWYGYLLILDAVIYGLQGRSFVSDRRRELLAMMFWSVPFWFLFEAYNLVIKNWYYVFTLRSDWIQGLFTWLAFATVLPACFLHTELVRALGWWRGVRWRPLAVGWPVLWCVGVAGVLCMVMPLVWPRGAFWMVWGATLGVPAVINYRIGAPSLLRDLEAGRPRRLLCLLTGGLWAGAAWEGLNFWARCKWIYTVPGLEEWKLFEMPLLGFVGFPVLAVSAFAFYSLLSHWVRGGRHWELVSVEAGATTAAVRPVPRLRYAAAVAAGVVFSLATFVAVLQMTVQSRRPLLSELEGLDARTADRLRMAGIPTPERLYQAVRRRGVEAVAQRAGVPPERLSRAFHHAGLALHKGMGTRCSRLLQAVGIVSPADLAGADARGLFQRLRGAAARLGLPAPRLAEVKVWVRAATASGDPRR